MGATTRDLSPRAASAAYLGWVWMGAFLLGSCGGSTGREDLRREELRKLDGSADGTAEDGADGADAADSFVDTSVDRVSRLHFDASLGVDGALPSDEGGEAGPTATDGGVEAAPPPPVCGNGVKEDGEECDDGNTEEFDGCSSKCVDTSRCDDCVKRVPECAQLLSGCSTLMGNVANGQLAGHPKAEACKMALSCFVTTGCAVATEDGPNYCYCGNLSVQTRDSCFQVKMIAKGDCKDQIEAAAETNEPSEIQSLFGDSDVAIGPVSKLFQCVNDHFSTGQAPPGCKSACAPGGGQ